MEVVGIIVFIVITVLGIGAMGDTVRGWFEKDPEAEQRRHEARRRSLKGGDDIRP